MIDVYDEVAGYITGLPDAHHLFPIHLACTIIAKEMLSYASSRLSLPSTSRADDTLIRSWADLYLAFETQFEIDEGVFADHQAQQSQNTTIFSTKVGYVSLSRR